MRSSPVSSSLILRINIIMISIHAMASSNEVVAYNINNKNNAFSAPSTANRTDEALQCHYDDLKGILKW